MAPGPPGLQCMWHTCAMHTAHLAGVDLNLLVALDALLTEAHVTRAARRVGLTQSAMSRALARLRDLLDDPLLVRTPQGMQPTPRAQALAAPLRRTLEDVEALVAGRPVFEPAHARRAFTVAAPDYAQAVLMPPVLQHLAREAPGVDLLLVAPPRDVDAALVGGEVDLVLGPQQPSTAGLVWTPLLSDTFACLLRKGHPALRRPLTPQRFAALSHLQVAPGGRPGGALDDALAARGLSRRVALRVTGFLGAAQLVAASDLVTTLPSRLAQLSAASGALVMMRPPVPVPGFTLAQAWHERLRQDPGHAWLRSVFVSVGRRLDGKR
jgi:DNA-binding transcriptional LysR family regulator